MSLTAIENVLYFVSHIFLMKCVNLFGGGKYTLKRKYGKDELIRAVIIQTVRPIRTISLDTRH